MMAEVTTIPPSLVPEVERRVARFCADELPGDDLHLLSRVSGRYLYIDMDRHGTISRFLRLTYLGSIDRWRWTSFTDGKYRPWSYNYTAPLRNPPPAGGLEAPRKPGRDPTKAMPEAEGTIADAIADALEIGYH